jgi:hypothetical protein
MTVHFISVPVLLGLSTLFRGAEYRIWIEVLSQKLLVLGGGRIDLVILDFALI